MKPENRFLYGLIVVLILFLIIHIGFVFFAGGQDFPLVSENYYQQELQYQERIDRLSRANELKNNIAVTISDGLIRLTYPDHFSTSPVQGSIRLFRPSDQRMDRTYPLTVTPDLSQKITTRGLAPGRWKLFLDWTLDGVTYSMERDLYVE